MLTQRTLMFERGGKVLTKQTLMLMVGATLSTIYAFGDRTSVVPGLERATGHSSTKTNATKLFSHTTDSQIYLSSGGDGVVGALLACLAAGV